MKRGALTLAILFAAVLFVGAESDAPAQKQSGRSAARPAAQGEGRNSAPRSSRTRKGAASEAPPANESASVAPESDADETEARQRQIVDRFLVVLEKNPRRGTALDRIYGYHVERGTLEELVEKYRQRTAKEEGDGAAWLILGLLEAQRGRDAAAVAAFRKAERAETRNYLAPYYLGQSLVLVGQPEEAAAAFERAIERKPPPAELLEVFQALGRVYQRAQRNEQALAIWTRLEKLFPDDARVQEQIASTLAEEGQNAEALARYEKLAKTTKDRYRQSLFLMEAGELQLKLGKTAEALAGFEKMLAELNPDSWLYREVRRRIEEAFLRNDDQAGLAKYYAGWLEKHGEDVDAMARLAHGLATQGRVPEAQTWLEKAIKLAPSRKELRLTFIEQLVYDQRWPEAIAQYEALDKSDPDNPDYLREWGQLILRDKSRDEAARKEAAAKVWRRLAAVRPKDPLAATQAADLFRHAEMPEEALEYYRRAVELDSESPQYREYLGEYYHALKRSDEALAAWREIAAGPNRNAKNLARLAEVLAGFGYLKEALEAMGQACELENDDFARQLKYAELLGQDQQYDAALVQLDRAAALAENDEEREAALNQQIKVFEGAERLSAEITTLAKRLEAAGEAAASDWYRLARLYEAARQFPEATAAINRSLELDGKSMTALTAAARIEEASGSLLEAANAYRKLAAIDRRSRTLYLTEVAKLEARLGRRDAALEAGRDLLAAAPGNPEHYEFFADLCFQLGENDEGLETLRRSLRANPSDPHVLLTLAKTLADRFRTDEAIELYWRAFEKSGELEAKLDVVSRLADLYLQTSQFDRLIERLERLRREAKESRELSICVAQAYHAAGDYGTAGQELTRLLSQNPSDTQLLQQLSSLLEAEGDLSEAVKYQQHLVRLAPSKEAEMRLAMLLSRSGQVEEAGVIWQHLTEKEEDPANVLRAVDSLINSGKRETALAITERILREEPNNWEALYREATALANDKPAEAAARCRAILELRLDDDEPSSAAKALKRRASQQPSGASTRQLSPLVVSLPVHIRTQISYQIRSATGLQTQNYYSNQPQFWTPSDFGQARMAALAWLLAFAEKEGKQDAFLADERAAREAAEKSENPERRSRVRWDWYYLQVIRQDLPETFAAAKALADGDDAMGQWVYLASLGNRVARSNSVARGGDSDDVDPLPADELERMLAAYRSLRQKRPELFEQGGYYGRTIIVNVTAELRRAKRNEEEQQLYREALAGADQGAAIVGMLALAGERGDVQGALELLDKLSRLPPGRSSANFAQNYSSSVANSLAHLMSRRADEKQHADVLRLYDRYGSFHLQQKRQAARPASTRRTTFNASSPYYSLYLGKKRSQVRVSFPVPNEYFDVAGILLLRNAYELYKRDDLLSDLVAHLRAKAEGGAPAADRVYPQLALAYVESWEESPKEAIDQFARACALAPDDSNLKLELAELHEIQGELDEALSAADAVAPLDQATMQRRELLALRVSVRSGEIERAREAAERLFGLRLDAETQVELAAQMRQLGMHDLAEAVMARAQRQAGNRSAALVALMLQYQAQNKADVAAQVAHQILRRAPARQSGNISSGQTTDDLARSQAIQVLARTGKLKELIERAEAQLKNSPGAVNIHQLLAEYYQAAGDRKKSVEHYQQMAAARPDDARLRYQAGQQLSQAGDPAAAVEHYVAAIKKEPRLLRNSYWQVEQTFRQAKKEDDLVKLLEEIDLKSLGDYYVIMNLIQNMHRTSAQRAQATKLFKMAWNAFPAQRDQLLSQMYDSEFWKTPEAYGYARETLIPRAGAVPADSWSGVGRVTSYSGDGRVNSLVGNFLEGASRRNDLELVAAELEATLKNAPEWTGGKLLLALVQARLGKTSQARAAIEALLADRRTPLPADACWVAGQELENRGELSDLAIKLYESTIDDANARLEYSYSPLKRLVGIYHKAGRDEEARALVLKLAKNNDDNGYDANYAAYRRVETRAAIGEELLQLGYAADATKVLDELLADRESLELARNFGGDYAVQRAERGMAKAMERLKPADVRRAIETLLDPPGEVRVDEPAVDLVLMVQPRSLARAEITSMLARALKSAEADPEFRAKADAKVKALLADYPLDCSVQIAAALVAFAGGQEDEIAAAVGRLQKLIGETPLEELPDGARANARQRAEAARQIGLWLVARECLQRESLRAAGALMAERALAAARRQVDPIYSLAMLRERGQAELDRGDRAAAERLWSEMLELVLPRRAESKKMPAEGAKPRKDSKENARRGATRRSFAVRRSLGTSLVAVFALWAGGFPEEVAFADDSAPPPRRAPAAPARPANRSEKSQGLAGVTVDQFEQAMEVAVLAAENGLHALSLRAVREALRAGPPVFPLKAMQRGGPQVVYSARSNRAGSEQTQIVERVEKRLGLLGALWRRHAAPPADVYEALVDAVMPAGRPAEIVLYAPPLSVASLRAPTSAGKMLVDWSVRAGCTDRLRDKIAERLNQPLAQLSGRVLLVQLALATGDRKVAEENLDWLSQRIVSETLQNSAELACHAALPALEHAELAPKALGIVETAAKNLAASARQSSNDEPAASLLLLAGRHHLRGGDAEAGRKLLLEYLAVCQQMNVRYSGDYGVFRRKQQLMKAATEFAATRQLDDALDMLGQFVDTSASPNYGQLEEDTAAAALFRQLAALPAAERYEKLKQWSLPAKDRKSVRLLATFISREDVPEIFSAPAGLGEGKNASGDAHSTLTALVEAAQGADKLDELAVLARQAANDPNQKIENAAVLQSLVSVARGQPEDARQAAQALLAELKENTPDKEDRSKPIRWGDYLAANACAANSDLEKTAAELLESLITYAQRSQNQLLLSHLRIDAAELEARRCGGRRQDDLQQQVPWRPAVYLSAAANRAGGAKPWWLVDGRQAVHVGGAGSDHLIFEYPLSGAFELSADLLDGGWSEANLGYGGLCCEVFAVSQNAFIYPVGRHEQLQCKTFAGRRGTFNHYVVRVEPESIQFSINGQLVYRDEPRSSAAPWLALFTSRERRTAFRNVRVRGELIIPREVNLVEGDRLDGWLTQFYSESQPARLPVLNAGNPDASARRASTLPPEAYDWRAVAGVIHGRQANESQARWSQSRLQYMRPLGDRETLRYEFLYEPELTHVHPALGRLAFLLEPEGVALHWMTDGDVESGGLPPDNRAFEPANRRGPSPLPLRAGEWNAVEVRLAESEISLTLNGTEIYRRAMEATNDRVFSFFHFKDRTSAQVRSVVLSGDAWPERLSDAQRANLLLPVDSSQEIDPRGLAETLLGEENAYLGTWQVWQTSQSLAPADRYPFLRDWVLPGRRDGAVVRLYGDFTPSAAAPPVAESVSPKGSPDHRSRRVQTGGELVVPALELVAVARELGKLEELRSLVEGREPRDELASQGKTALRALIAMAGNDDQAARAALAQLYPDTKIEAKGRPEHVRWPAVVAAWKAFERPALRPMATTMLNQLARASRGAGGRWESIANHLNARALLELAPDGGDGFGAALPLKQWQTAVHATAATRGVGRPPMHWQHRPGGLTHYAGHDFDYAYFAVPLRGNFELEAELSTFGWRDVRTCYATLLSGIVWDLKNFSLSNFERARPNGLINPPLERPGEWYRYRLVVQDGQYTAFANGRRIFSERLPKDPDPWLAFRAWGAYASEVRNVRITGNPQVPDVLDLSAATNLDSWLAEYYAESVTGETPQWSKRGDEIVGRKLADVGEAVRESVLQYHRPLFEDGEIEYEFYYQSGEATAAPAIDRLAFLLEPSGVELHWLSDAQHDRTGLTPDNRTTEKENRRGPAPLPLKERDWNQVRLALQGDAIALHLNGVEIYQRNLEPTNQRVFGLYHDAARSETRVRNVRYRGDWPKSFPSLAEQELAVSPAVRATLESAKTPARFEFDFRGDRPLPAQLAPIPKTGEKYTTRTAAGARIVLPAKEEKPTTVGYETAFRMRGDFEIVAVYSGLKTTPAPKAWGPGVDVHVRLDAPANADIMLERRQVEDGRHLLQEIIGYELPDKLDRPLNVITNPLAAAAGKLKIVRKGPVIYYLFADHDSDDYRLLSERPFSDADAVRTHFYARAFSKESGVDVVLEKLSIRAEAFVSAGQAPSTTTRPGAAAPSKR